MSRWREELGAIADRYGTNEIIVQTLGGKYDLERQVESFARVAEAAGAVRAPAPAERPLAPCAPPMAPELPPPATRAEG